jgi:hypothetical protein
MAIEASLASNCGTGVFVSFGVVTVHNTTAFNNTSGYYSQGKLSVDHCVASGGDTGVVIYAGDASITACTADNATGIYVGPTGIARLTLNTITRNAVGIDTVIGAIYSTGDNMVDGNTTANTTAAITAANKL